MTKVHVDDRRTGKTTLALEKAFSLYPKPVLFVSHSSKNTINLIKHTFTTFDSSRHQGPRYISNVTFVDAWDTQRIKDIITNQRAEIFIIYDELPFECDYLTLSGHTHTPQEHHFLSDPWINLTYEAFLECKVYFAPQKCKNKNRFLLVARNQTWEFQHKEYLEDRLPKKFKELSREAMAPIFCDLVENGDIVFLSL